MFGYEIGHPAYPPTSDWKKMVALESDVDGLLNSIGDAHDGIIIWEMYKPTSGYKSDEASTNYVLNSACKSFGLGSSYNCNADFISWSTEDIFSILKLLL